jgi:hypothetical protein
MNHPPVILMYTMSTLRTPGASRVIHPFFYCYNYFFPFKTLENLILSYREDSRFALQETEGDTRCKQESKREKG